MSHGVASLQLPNLISKQDNSHELTLSFSNILWSLPKALNKNKINWTLQSNYCVIQS